MISLTYNEWKRLGYVVKKGEKSSSKKKGKPVFTEKQVTIDVETMYEMIDSQENDYEPFLEKIPIDLEETY